jgi:hypothetical protein
VQNNDMKTAFNVFNGGNGELKRYCGKYLINQGSTKLIEMINGAERHAKFWMLRLILLHAERQLVDKVFDALNLTNNVLGWVARNANLACMPQRFTYLLKKIDDKKEQEGAVRGGVHTLVVCNKSECLDPLLSTLRKGKFLNQDLENVAIRTAFGSASRCNDDRVIPAMRFFDHPAVSAMNYSEALYDSDRWGDWRGKFFYWLLERADRQDLEAVRSDCRFPKMGFTFRRHVNNALRIVGPESRHEIGRQKRIALMKEVLEGDVPTVLLTLIGGYIE